MEKTQSNKNQCSIANKPSTSGSELDSDKHNWEKIISVDTKPNRNKYRLIIVFLCNRRDSAWNRLFRLSSPSSSSSSWQNSLRNLDLLLFVKCVRRCKTPLLTDFLSFSSNSLEFSDATKSPDAFVCVPLELSLRKLRSNELWFIIFVRLSMLIEPDSTASQANEMFN